MDLMKITRELGAAIQLDERYLAYVAAKAANDADSDLNALIGKLNLIQLSYQNEAQGDAPDEAKLNTFDKEFREVYGELMLNKNMQVFEEAKNSVDAMMNDIIEILRLCVNGADPATCEPEPEEHNCSGDCHSCGGGC